MKPSRIALVLILAGGCGYRFAARGPALPPGIRTVQVPLFRNHTSEVGLDAVFTDALRGELARVGREGGEASDAVAEGEVVTVGGGAALSKVTVEGGIAHVTGVNSYRVEVSALVTLKKGGEKVAEARVSGGEDFPPDSARPCSECAAGESCIGGNCVSPTWMLQVDANRRLAIGRLAKTLMRRALEQLSVE